MANKIPRSKHLTNQIFPIGQTKKNALDTILKLFTSVDQKEHMLETFKKSGSQLEHFIGNSNQSWETYGPISASQLHLLLEQSHQSALFFLN